MTEPIERFTKEVESSLDTVLATTECMADKGEKIRHATAYSEKAYDEALASIQAATAKLLDELKKEIPSSAHIPAKFASDGYIEADLTNSYNQAVEDAHEAIDQLALELRGGRK